MGEEADTMDELLGPDGLSGIGDPLPADLPSMGIGDPDRTASGPNSAASSTYM